MLELCSLSKRLERHRSFGHAGIGLYSTWIRYAAERRASEDGTDSASNFHKLDFTSTNQDVISDGQTSGRHSEERNCTSDVWKRVARVMLSSVMPVPSAAKWAHGRHLQ